MLSPGMIFFLYWGFRHFDLIHSDAANIRDLFEMQVAVHLYGICGVRNIGFHRADIVLAVVRHYVVGGYKSGYVSACFFGQIVVYFPIIRFAACAPDGFVDGAGAAVVGGDYQVPVLVDGIHIFQVACGGPGSLNRSRRSSTRLLLSRPYILPVFSMNCHRRRLRRGIRPRD